MPPIVRHCLLAPLLALAATPAWAGPEDAEQAAPAEARPAPGKARIARNPAYYTTDVTLQSQKDKRAGLVRALGQVVVRLTGDPKAAQHPVVRRAAGNVESLVRKSEFRQEQDTVNGAPVYRTILGVAFDPEAVDAVIATAGLKLWTSERPRPILWLAIDDGRGPRLVTGQQTNVVKPLANRGLERGMRFLLPAGSAAEKAAVTAIWRLDATALQPLTARYKNDAQLVGKVYRMGSGWAADWLLTQSGKELARWSFADADARRVIASGVDEGANAVARRDARGLEGGPAAGLVAVEIEGIRSQGDYIRLVSYLQGLPVVRRIAPAEARPGSLRLHLDLGVGLRGFRNMVASGGTLRAVGDAEAGGTARFQLQ